jgi:hypothetical protein
VLLSPLIAAILLALLPDRRYEEVLHQLAARNAAAAEPTPAPTPTARVK